MNSANSSSIVVMLFIFAGLFFGWSMPYSQEEHFSNKLLSKLDLSRSKALKWILFIIFFLFIVATLYNYPDQAILETYSLAAAILISQITLTGRLFWSRRFGWVKGPQVITKKLIKEEAYFIILAAFFSWLIGELFYFMGTHWLVPAVSIIVIGLTAGYFVTNNKKYLIPAITVYCADVIWSGVKLYRVYADIGTIQLLYGCADVLLMIIGIIWLILKPSLKSIIYLTIISFIYLLHFSLNMLVPAISSTDNRILIIVILATSVLLLWKIVIPLSLALIGLRHMQEAE